jgi:formate dehydrogenase maturation protein FdhE
MPRPGAFLETIIAFLLPHFAGTAADLHEARAEIIDTLAAYATRTRGELLLAAQIIALGMSTLDVLAEAKTVEMSTSMRIRFRGCANGLNRSTIQTEKALRQRLACAAFATPEADNVKHSADGEVAAAIEHLQTKIDLHRNRLSGARQDAGSQRDRNKQLWSGAMIDTLKQLGTPPRPAPGGET